MLHLLLPDAPVHPARRATPEIELLLCCARTGPNASVLARAAEIISGGLDWKRLIDVASRHRVLPLLHLNLDRMNWTGVPREVRDELRASQQANAAASLRLVAALLRVLGRLDQANIASIPFKGVVLASRAYGDVALRDVGDLDLLVHRRDILKAVELLESAGFRPGFPTSTAAESDYLRKLTGPRRRAYLLSHCEHHLVDEEGQVNVDLHWAITLREFCLPLNTDGLWRRATAAPLAGRTLRALCDEDLLLVLCVNGAKDCWERLDRVCDVAELIRAAPHLDWDLVTHLARQCGAQRMLRLGLSLATGLLDAALPQKMQRFVEDDSPVQKLAADVRERLLGVAAPMPESRSARGLFHLKSRERWRDRAQYCASQLRPGVGDWAGLPLPAPLGFLHYVLRPFRLAARYWLRRPPAPSAGRSSSS